MLGVAGYGEVRRGTLGGGSLSGGAGDSPGQAAEADRGGLGRYSLTSAARGGARGAIVGGISRRRRTWAALLSTVALLSCHGLFGAFHVLVHDSHGAVVPVGMGRTAGEVHVAMHAPGEEHGARTGTLAVTLVPEGAGEPLAHFTGGQDYFAVLLALAGVAFFLRRAAGRMRPTGEAFSSRAHPRVAGGCLPRGPSLQVLQVFRL